MRHSHPSEARPPRIEHVIPERVPVNDLGTLLRMARLNGVPESDLPRLVENLRNRRATSDAREINAARTQRVSGVL